MAQRTFADKLDTLFRLVTDGGKEHSHRAVARYLTDYTGQKHSPTFVTHLRTGKAPDPRRAIIEGLAEFFNVPAAYFFAEDADADRIEAELELLSAIRRHGVTSIATRPGEPLDADGLRQVARLLDQSGREDEDS